MLHNGPGIHNDVATYPCARLKDRPSSYERALPNLDSAKCDGVRTYNGPPSAGPCATDNRSATGIIAYRNMGRPRMGSHNVVSTQNNSAIYDGTNRPYDID
jgi:hypothetical protein